MFQLKFWGTRGSIPTSGADIQEFGGATCCVSAQFNDTFVVFDAGTGIYPLGAWLLAQNIKQAHLFLSHLHYDHIIGLPFFKPLWQPDNTIHIYAGHVEGVKDLETFMHNAISPPLFPIPLLKSSLSDITLKNLSPGDKIDLTSKVTIETVPLNHPGGALGYKLNHQGKSVCYITDNEHPNDGHDQLLIEFVKDTDCLIYDATFSGKEYANFKGWGHSTWEEATYVARQAHVKQLVIYHHNPDHNDATMREIEKQAQQHFPNTIVAREGFTIDL